ncbi:uncharacterized protein LOC117621659 [Prunus dulcis]|uniref:uncharacterized protein LOC117621659 n=1 Tax=Prunus dulcis TaxID=3755 RepID=UPI001481F25B|nr:uncharacterized protein LOC117621659 [Prunus dulcis]
MGPKRGGFRRGTRQSSRVRGQNSPPEPEDLPIPEPVQEPVEQSFVGGPSGPAPPMPTIMGDPNLQQTLELLTQALSRTGQSRDPSLGYADQAKRTGQSSDPAVAEEWIERMERIIEVMAVPQDRRVTLATFFLTRNARYWWESVKRRYRDPSAITWPVFRAAFDSQYYPQAYQNLKMEEFLQLEQGSMTVLEYEKKFNELSKYCIPLVEDETSLIESSQMMVRARGEPRRRQFEMGGPSQGSSKRGSYSSGSSSGRSYGGFRPGISSSGGSNHSGSYGSRPAGSSVRGSGRQPPSAAGRMRSPQCTGGEATVVSPREIGTQGRTQSRGASSSGGTQTSVASRGGSQQQGRGERARATGRVYHISQQQAQASPDVVTGTLLVFGTPARVLIDPRATHSFVTPSFAHNAVGRLSALGDELAISVPTGEIFHVGTVYRDSAVLVGDVCLEADLIPLEMVGLDVILGMDWLAKHHASVDCFRKEVVLRSPGRPEVTFHGERSVEGKW